MYSRIGMEGNTKMVHMTHSLLHMQVPQAYRDELSKNL